MLQTLLSVISYLTIVYAVALLIKKNRHQTDIILSVWLFLVSSINIINNGKWEISLTFAQCVFLYLYVKYTISGSPFKLNSLMHFIPFLIASTVIILFPPIMNRYFHILYIIMILFICIYFAMSIKTLVHYKRKNTEDTSTDRPPYISWLSVVITFTIATHFIKIIPTVVMLMGGNKANPLIINFIILLLLNIVGVKAVRLDLNFFKKTKQNKAEQNKTKSYSTYNLKESEIELLEKKLLSLMESEKLYLDPDLNLKNLSDNLGISSHHLSFLLNTRFNLNFYEFINNYRLEMVKDELVNPNKKHLSIYAIANDCGFNSQSTFNRAFKQKVGLSPSEYRKQHITSL